MWATIHWSLYSPINTFVQKWHCNLVFWSQEWIENRARYVIQWRDQDKVWTLKGENTHSKCISKPFSLLFERYLNREIHLKSPIHSHILLSVAHKCKTYSLESHTFNEVSLEWADDSYDPDGDEWFFSLLRPFNKALIFSQNLYGKCAAHNVQ